MKPKKYDLLIFDLDGTLIDSSDDIAYAINHALQKNDIAPLDHQTITGHIGSGVRSLIRSCLSSSVSNRTDEDDLYDRVYENFTTYYGSHLMDHTKLFDGAGQLIKNLTDIPMAILTNKPEQMSRTIIDHFKLSPYIQDIVGSDTLSTRKPDPEGLLHLIRTYGMSPERTLFVGDSIIDSQAAEAAQVPFCLVTHGYAKGGEQETATHVINNLAELIPIVNS